MRLQEADPDNFEHWENLIKAAENTDGNLNRNSSPQALATFRDAYDRFLAKFPLLFGYWKKYADTEFNIAGPESAEMVWSPLVIVILLGTNYIARSSKEDAPASPTRLTCGPTTVHSRWIRLTIRVL